METIERHRFDVIVGIAFLSFSSVVGVDLNICDRVISSYYEPVETRRGFNAMESRGVLYRLRLVVELFPESNVRSADDNSKPVQIPDGLKRLRNSLDECLSCDPVKSLFRKAMESHGPDRKPSEVLTRAFNKSLHECLDPKVPESFTLAVDLFCDWKITGWR